MYQFVDRPVSCLDIGCRFLVWSLRSWTLVARSNRCPGPTLAPAFAKWRMISGLQPFLRMMVALDRDCLEEMRLCTLNCNRISEDEAVLLTMFAAIERGDTQAACNTLELLVAEDGAGDILDAMVQLSGALSSAGIGPREPIG